MKNLLRATTLSLFVFAAGFRPGQAWPQDEEHPVDVEASVKDTPAARGSTTELRVTFRIQPGYHIYGPEEKQAIPTTIQPEPAEGIQWGEAPTGPPRGVSYPEAERDLIQQAGSEVLEYWIYRKEVVASLPFRISEDAPLGERQIAVLVTYLHCSDEGLCGMPTRKRRVVATLQTVAPSGKTPDLPAPLPAQQARQAGASQNPADRSAQNAGALPGSQQTPTSSGDAPGAKTEFQEAIGRGALWALLASYLAGIVSCFFGCVYPMLPITLSFFTAQSASRARTVFLALAYVLTIAIVYSILGLLAAFFGKGMGAWLVNPYVVAVMAAIFVLLAFSLFGLYEIRLPTGSLGSQTPRQGVLGACVMGGLASILAAPCTGPFLLGLLAFLSTSYFATEQGIFVGTSSLFVYGLGLGTPFLFLALASGAIARMPRSGQWMEEVKHFCGFIMLGMSIFVLKNVLSPAVIALAGGILFLIWGNFLGAFARASFEDPWHRKLSKSAGIIAVLLGAYLFVGTLLQQGFILPPFQLAATSNEKGTLAIDWRRDYEAGMAEARDAGKPVFVDFYADW